VVEVGGEANKGIHICFVESERIRFEQRKTGRDAQADAIVRQLKLLHISYRSPTITSRSNINNELRRRTRGRDELIDHDELGSKSKGLVTA